MYSYDLLWKSSNFPQKKVPKNWKGTTPRPQRHIVIAIHHIIEECFIHICEFKQSRRKPQICTFSNKSFARAVSDFEHFEAVFVPSPN